MKLISGKQGKMCGCGHNLALRPMVAKKKIQTMKRALKRIGNMYKKGNPRLSEEVILVAEEIKKHLKTILK